MATRKSISNNADTSIPPYGRITQEIANTLPPYALALYVVIVCNIDRASNKLSLSIDQLADLSGMSRSSIIKYTAELETADVLAVRRNQTGYHADMNIYSLIGEGATVALYTKPQSESNTPPSGSKKPVPMRENDGLLKIQSMNHDDVDDISTDSDSGEISVKNEAVDHTYEDENDFQHQLKNQGVHPPMIKKIADYPQKNWDTALEIAKSQGAENPIGYAITILKNGFFADIPTPQRKSQTFEIPAPEIKSSALEIDFQKPYTREKVEPCPDCGKRFICTCHIEDATPAEPAPGTTEYNWEAAYNQLELQLDRASFDTWLHSAELDGFDAETGTYTIIAKNKYARDMLQHRLERNITRVLSDITGTEAHIIVKTNQEEAKS